MESTVARANGIDICFETFGDPVDPTLLLVMGLGVQMTGWDVEFVQQFVDAGFHVVRYDHRDTGQSTRFESDAPDLAAALRGETVDVLYTLDDMADDGIALLDVLQLERVHLLGVSMGGMVAQLMAIRHPARVLSLCSIMSTTGARDVGRPNPEALEAITNTNPKTRSDIIEASVATSRIISGGGFAFDEDSVRRRSAASYDRAYHPSGKTRHQVAIRTAEDRTQALRGLRIPVTVIHGKEDPLVGLSGGEATAAAIPGAELVVIPGMGHEIPVGVRPHVISAVRRNRERADTAAEG